MPDPFHVDDQGPPVRVLCLDGGGVRGAFQAALLDRLQGDLSILKEIDVLVGTSTGSIIAAGIGADKTTAALVALYGRLSGCVFAGGSISTTCMLLAKGARYSKATLKRELSKIFDDRSLRSLSRRTLVTSFALDHYEPIVFDSEGRNADMSVVDAILASTAAPTFFAPHYVDRRYFLDGGVWANNPAIAAMSCLGIPLERLRILSLGTGSVAHIEALKPTTLRSRFINLIPGLRAAASTFDVLLATGSLACDMYCRSLLGKHYLRIDPALPRSIRLDDHKAVDEILMPLAEKGLESIQSQVNEWLAD